MPTLSFVPCSHRCASEQVCRVDAMIFFLAQSALPVWPIQRDSCIVSPTVVVEC